MNVWLCPVKPKSWRTARSKKVFGVPKRGLKIFRQVRPGDLLVFHVLKPLNGIVSICKVTSEIFEDNQDIWGKNAILPE
jgi:predicted RNA-binding protein